MGSADGLLALGNLLETATSPVLLAIDQSIIRKRNHLQPWARPLWRLV